MTHLLHASALRFRGLQGQHPASWPRLAQAMCCLVAAASVFLLGWPMHLHDSLRQLENSIDEHRDLKNAYLTNVNQAAALPLLQGQKQLIAQTLLAQERQLPRASDMGALYDEISRTGAQHHLQVSLIKPGEPEAGKTYVALPIAIELRGRYHDIGRFAAALTFASRLLVLTDLELSANDQDRFVVLRAVALAYRLPDPASPLPAHNNAPAASRP